MSEYTETLQVCDRCYPDFFPAVDFFPTEDAKGVWRGAWEDAEAVGWRQVDYGSICPDCAKAENEDSGGDVVLGDAAIASVTQGIQEE